MRVDSPKILKYGLTSPYEHSIRTISALYHILT